MSEAMRETMAEPFAPGNLVRLRQPYRPDDYRPEGPMGLWRQANRDAWRAWPGFTHGIVALALARSLGGQAVRVSLHLYDPQHHLLYFHSSVHGGTVPVYVDFHVKELIPHKIAADPGYAPLPTLGE